MKVFKTRCIRYDLHTMCFICNLKTSAAHAHAGTDIDAAAPSSPRWQARRAFLLAAGAGAAGSAMAQVDVGSSSSLRKLVPAETLENSARQQYAKVLAEARAQNTAPPYLRHGRDEESDVELGLFYKTQRFGNGSREKRA